MATLGRSGDAHLAEAFARAIAAELKAVGVTMDFAPVLDVHTNPKNPVIGDRALAEDAKLVATLGAAIIKAMQDEGVAACGKHFPGHGDTNLDSHFALPLVEHPPGELGQPEIDAAEGREHDGSKEHVMEVRDHEVGIRDVDVERR